MHDTFIQGLGGEHPSKHSSTPAANRKAHFDLNIFKLDELAEELSSVDSLERTV